MSVRFLTGLWLMQSDDWYKKWRIRGYPGSMRDFRGRPMLVDGLPFDYMENKNNVGTKGTGGDPPRS